MSLKPGYHGPKIGVAWEPPAAAAAAARESRASSLESREAKLATMATMMESDPFIEFPSWYAQ